MAGPPTSRLGGTVSSADTEEQRVQILLDAQKVEASNFAHLGDLRLKQGRTREAIEAYQQAVAKFQEMERANLAAASRTFVRALQVTDPRASADAELRGEMKLAKEPAANSPTAEVSEVVIKLALAYLSLGDPDGSLRALKMVNPSPAGRLLNATKATEPAKAWLPEKLIVTVTKDQLDQVAAGKLRFEDFKQAATVQVISPQSHREPKEKTKQ
jgi:hypothetical protein